MYNIYYLKDGHITNYFHVFYRILVINTLNIIFQYKNYLLLLEGIEASFLLFPKKSIYIQIIQMRSIYYLKYGHIDTYFHTIYRVLYTNTLFYFNGRIKNIFPI